MRKEVKLDLDLFIVLNAISIPTEGSFMLGGIDSISGILYTLSRKHSRILPSKKHKKHKKAGRSVFVKKNNDGIIK